MVIRDKIHESFQIYWGVRQGSVLSPVIFNMIMDMRVTRITKGQESSEIPKTMVYTDGIVIWETKESTLENSRGLLQYVKMLI